MRDAIFRGLLKENTYEECTLLLLLLLEEEEEDDEDKLFRFQYTLYTFESLPANQYICVMQSFVDY